MWLCCVECSECKFSEQMNNWVSKWISQSFCSPVPRRISVFASYTYTNTRLSVYQPQVGECMCELESESRFLKSNTHSAQIHSVILSNNKKYCLHLGGLDTFFDVICSKSNTPSAYYYVCMAGRRWQCGLNNYVK